MSTFMANAGNVERKWYIIDAADKPLGRVATQVARILRGKHKPTFTPHVDTGDHVIVINAAKTVLTGRKLDQKTYKHHSGYVGGLKEVTYRELLAKKPELAVMIAVKGMLPHNSLGRASLKKLRVYRGAEHENQAQKPEVWTQEI
ncbi:MAG: 50S ribosomal protein L13 [Clostridia bacterium]